jgi:M6 family metalloprotease-like protein
MTFVFIEVSALGHPPPDLFDSTWEPIELLPNRSSTSTKDRALETATNRRLSPAEGTITALVLLLRFSDHANMDLPSREYFQKLCDEQIKDYMNKQSYGKYEIVTCNVKDWMTTDNTEAFYANGERGLRGSVDTTLMFQPLLTNLDQAGEEWTQYDSNRDGVIDAVLVIHSGYASEQGPGPGCGAPDPMNRIYSQGHMGSSAWLSQNGLATLGGFAIASAWDRVCVDRPAGIGIMVHEWTHTFGAIDLYDFDTGNLGGTASFDLMSNAFGPIGNTSIPGSIGPCSKVMIGWITPQVATNDGEYPLRTSTQFPDAIKIEKGFAENEYLLIENRQPEYFDRALFGGGILIFHVIDDKRPQGQSGWPGNPSNWPGDGRVYACSILPADGNYDIEKGLNNGDVGDIWTKDRVLGPGGGSNFPNTDSYKNGVVTSTGITIKVLSDPGQTMTLQITGLGSGNPEVQVPTPPPAGGDSSPTPKPVLPWERTEVPAPVQAPPTPKPAVPPTPAPVPPPTPQPVVPQSPAPVPPPTSSPVASPTNSPVVPPIPQFTPSPTQWTDRPGSAEMGGHAQIDTPTVESAVNSTDDQTSSADGQDSSSDGDQGTSNDQGTNAEGSSTSGAFALNGSGVGVLLLSFLFSAL